MTRMRLTFLTAIASLALAGGALAEVAISKEEAGANVVVEAKNATVDEVLEKLGEQYGFKTERTGGADAQRISGRYAGPIDTVLARVLRGEGHLIERSPEAPTGIVRIVVFGSGQGGQTAVAQRQGRYRPTQANTGEDDEAAMAQAEAEEAEAEQARMAQQQALQARQMRRNRVMPQPRARTPRNDGIN